MGSMLVVTLREGIEAFLIVALAATYLRKTGRSALLPAVWWGAGVAGMLSILLGAFLAGTVVTPFWEGVLAFVAAVLVVSMVVLMMSAGRHMGAEIGQRIETAVRRHGTGAWLGIFGFTVLMITREGMEMAFITVAVAQNEGSTGMVAGALSGALLAALVSGAWVRWGHRVNLGLFFQVTSIFLFIFAAQLVLYSFHEFTEAGAIPGIDNAKWHLATEEWAEGEIGQWITASMVILPLAWLAWRRFADAALGRAPVAGRRG